MASANSKTREVAVIGTGPAGLMAADRLSRAPDVHVELIEKRKSPGRKLLVAGSSGLNIGNSLPIPEFIRHYTGDAAFWRALLEAYPPREWLRFVEELGHKTFEGTSGRYFVDATPREGAHAPEKGSKLLHSWIARLRSRGVTLSQELECVGVRAGERVSISLERTKIPVNEGLENSRGSVDPAREPREVHDKEYDAVLFALGGASWEPPSESGESELRWPGIFRAHGIAMEEFRASNCGYRVSWPEPLLREAEGLPLKTFTLTTWRGTRKGEAVITRYGIEGTPVYAVGATGQAFLDLKPDLEAPELLAKLASSRENLSPIRRVKKLLGLSPAALALVFHLSPKDELASLERLARRIKRFPLELEGPQPLSEAISSSGGIRLDELDPRFMLKRLPGVFAAGEMLDWDAPTGGFLIQACVSQGHAAAEGILAYLASG